ncbi:hypothetical protein [uncultured Tateyamaria sp.]|uniref:hypothetical protein n=1 Tax=uncultured Tateyamaria sp. TaxID=455651 RepID=UPI00260D068E|nr:hypothetical protein [uncultured Tateyamaria sp.]
MTRHPKQMGFDALLQDTDVQNAARVFEKETAHLSNDWTEALTYHHAQIEQHHAAMLANDFDAAMDIRKDAHLLATKLNGGAPGILADEDAPGYKLDAEARAESGAVPLWGQSGTFDTEAAGLWARVDMSGMFGIGATAMPYVGFSVRATDHTKPFLSETGYRSFLGCSVPPEPRMTPEGFVKRVIEAYVANELNGQLRQVNPRWCD